MAKKAAPTDDIYASEKAKIISRETLPLSEAMEGATKPMIIRGTRKKIIWPLTCLTTSTIFINSSGMTNPAMIPTTTAKIKTKIVFEKIFFIMLFTVF